jgi:DNA-binding beta-propeller fold protein YncE
MARVFLLLSVAGLLAVALVSSFMQDSGEPPLRDETSLGLRAGFGKGPDGARVVALSLPAQNRLAFVDVLGGEVTYSPEFPRHEMTTPGALLPWEEKVMVTGTGHNRIVEFDPRGGRLLRGIPLDGQPYVERDDGVYEEGLGSWAVVGKGDIAYVAADTAIDEGIVFEVDLREMTVRRQFAVPTGQSGMTLDSEGRLWILTEEAPRLSILDVEDGILGRSEFNGLGLGIASLSSGGVVVTVPNRNQIALLDGEGRFAGRVAGLGPSPWGIATDDSGDAFVVAAGDEQGMGGRLYVVDVLQMSVRYQVPFPPTCIEPREIVLVGVRAAVTCASSGAIAVVDLNERIVVDVLSLTGEVPEDRKVLARLEQPRRPILLTLSPN